MCYSDFWVYGCGVALWRYGADSRSAPANVGYSGLYYLACPAKTRVAHERLAVRRRHIAVEASIGVLLLIVALALAVITEGLEVVRHGLAIVGAVLLLRAGLWLGQHVYHDQSRK